MNWDCPEVDGYCSWSMGAKRFVVPFFLLLRLLHIFYIRKRKERNLALMKLTFWCMNLCSEGIDTKWRQQSVMTPKHCKAGSIKMSEERRPFLAWESTHLGSQRTSSIHETSWEWMFPERPIHFNLQLFISKSDSMKKYFF